MISCRQALAILFGAAFLTVWAPARAQTIRVEIHAVQTTTLTDEQFLNGVREGKPVAIAGELRIPRPGTERLPAVVFLHGSGGIRPTPDSWSQEFLGMGIATFVMDSFAGRGIVNTNSGNQDQLGRLAMIIDAYRALDLLARHPRIDPERIALMGFSRGGQSALYASLRRFQRMHGTPGKEYAAYIPFYAACNTTFREDADVADRPIRIHHGVADDYVPVAPCRPYVARLRAAGKNVTLTEYPNALHTFDSPAFKTPTKRPQSETTRNCTLHEESIGRLVNSRTGQLFTYKDPCVEFGPTVGYNADAHAASVKAVKEFLASTFRVP
jgi:dienelactone hydrolase